NQRKHSALRKFGCEDFSPGLKGKSFEKTLKAFLELPLSIYHSIQILRKFDPDLVMGVGGYASGPVLLAAWLLRIPRVICEQNSVPGFTNRTLGHYFVKTIFGAFQNCAKYFPPGRFVLTGNPLRVGFSLPPSSEKSGVLILGGSLGAKPINNIVPTALALCQKIKITHQTGKTEVEAVQAAYKKLGLEAEVTAFIEDMPAAYAGAQLVISRAGAMTCSELTAMGVPSILIPFPQAIDDHQTENAQELVSAGAAILVKQSEMTSESLAGRIQILVSDLKNLENMANKARQIGKSNAADIVAKKVVELC
ncbi:MAG: undecaprenyldiphospho-muramoylpentapeptide beta-N-acetylglucosaminyltransferase, partial [Myxococcaceae bacterium]